MGEVAITYRLMPDGPDVDIESIVETIRTGGPEWARVNDVQIKPIAFGLKSIEALIVMGDKSGNNPDDVEKFLAGIPGIQNVETVNMTLL